MSSASNSVMQINENLGNMPMNVPVYRSDELRARKDEHGEVPFLETIVGRRGGLRGILSLAEAVAPTNTTVLIAGETGTGKEIIARAIHEFSPRRNRNLVKVNCAAIPAGLLESELFGHERGAFTGAVNSHAGRFELADRGTLFLDEIGDMPLELQAKMLRVLQEREFEAVGSTRTTRVDVRVVVATNQDVKQMVRDREFREDLYYRLNAFPVYLPPLRERKADIPELVEHFVQHFAESMDKTIETIPEETMRSLVRHHWPGNIRELRNVIERAVIFAHGSALDFDLPAIDSSPGPTQTAPRLGDRAGLEYRTDSEMQRLERENLFAVLQKASWKIKGVDGAAELLGVKPTTLIARIEKMGLKRPA